MQLVEESCMSISDIFEPLTETDTIDFPLTKICNKLISLGVSMIREIRDPCKTTNTQFGL